MLWRHILYGYIPLGGGGRHHIGARLDLVGDYGIGHAAKLLHAVYLYGIGARAPHVRAHGVQKVRKIHHMGFPCGVLNYRHPTGLYRREHNIDRCSHRHHVQVDMRPKKIIWSHHGDHTAVIKAVLAAQSLEALQMLVNGPHPEVTATRQGHQSPSAPAQKRADKVVGAPHTPGHLGADNMGVNRPRINLYCVPVRVANRSPHLLQDICGVFNVGNIRQVLDTAGGVGQDHRRQYGHRGIFSAVYYDLAAKAATAMNHIFIQISTSYGAVKATIWPPPGIFHLQILLEFMLIIIHFASKVNPWNATYV